MLLFVVDDDDDDHSLAQANVYLLSALSWNPWENLHDITMRYLLPSMGSQANAMLATEAFLLSQDVWMEQYHGSGDWDVKWAMVWAVRYNNVKARKQHQQ